MIERIEEILHFWFGDYPDEIACHAARRRLWFGKSKKFDLQVKAEFEQDVLNLIAGDYDRWPQFPRGRLAAILLIDQFCRQIYRDTPAAFSHDGIARRLCLEGIEIGHDRELDRMQRFFFYLPLEHTEDRDIQRQCVDLYRALLDDAPPAHKPVYQDALNYAVAHQQIIQQFGRFPHRNAVLGRESSAEESAFLQQPGSAF